MARSRHRLRCRDAGRSRSGRVRRPACSRSRVNGAPTATSPLSECSTETSQATIRTPRSTPASRVTMSSLENRAVLDPRSGRRARQPERHAWRARQRRARSATRTFSSPRPACRRASRTCACRTFSCTGLVPGERYTLVRSRGHAVRHARADFNGTITVTDLPGPRPVARGDVFDAFQPCPSGADDAPRRRPAGRDRRRRDRSSRPGRAQPGEYWGAPLTSLPSSSLGRRRRRGRNGHRLPADGDAAGLPDASSPRPTTAAAARPSPRCR